MRPQPNQLCIAFQNGRLIANGTAAAVVPDVKRAVEADSVSPVFIFDEATSDVVEIDFRGTVDEVIARLDEDACREENAAKVGEKPLMRRAGRPSLGVVAREVTLLPRHWEWLNCQPGGASVALRKLVDEARRISGSRDQVRKSQESAYRFMLTMAGDLAGYEEATRALFGGNAERFAEMTAAWPADVREHAERLAAEAFPAAAADSAS